MASSTGSSHQLFKSGTVAEFEEVYKLYSKVLNLKASKITKPGGKKDLLDLDKWYQVDLSATIKSRAPNRFITHEEITKLMKWKLSRGKFRPRLLEMVQSNSAELVESSSKKAFKKLPNLSAAIKELTVLKAVGPATASAVLAAGAPEHAPFMADESMLAIPGLVPIKYTPPFYDSYAEQIKSCVKRLGKEDSSNALSAHKVEMTLWTHYMANKLDPSLLKPTSKSTAKKRKAPANENDTTAAKTKATSQYATLL